MYTGAFCNNDKLIIMLIFMFLISALSNGHEIAIRYVEFSDSAMLIKHM